MTTTTEVEKTEIIFEKEYIENLLTKLIEKSAARPELQWGNGMRLYAPPKVAVANSALDFDPYRGLREPHLVGRYPIDIEGIWKWRASKVRQRLRKNGTVDDLNMPVQFDDAKEEYGRIVVVAAMLPFSHEHVLRPYRDFIRGETNDPDLWCIADGLNQNLLDRALEDMARIMDKRGFAVVPMTNARIGAMSEYLVAPVDREAHGFGNKATLSLKSWAHLTGLAQIGRHTMVFRDENGARYFGSLGLLVAFDKDDPADTDSILGLSDDILNKARKMADFTSFDAEINSERYCGYYDDEGKTACAVCVKNCRSGALANPLQNNQFNMRRCCSDRGGRGQIVRDYSCARCATLCVVEGRRNQTP